MKLAEMLCHGPVAGNQNEPIEVAPIAVCHGPIDGALRDASEQ
jgi:hypothetical protein